MSRGADERGIVGVNWGTSRFRAYRIAADGTIVDEIDTPGGVASLDRAGMAAAVDELVARWPDHGPIYAAGMVGSNIGWTELPYAVAPASATELVCTAVRTQIGGAEVVIVPGVTCRRSADGAPDVMRGEEVELLGLTAMSGNSNDFVVLPGTHSKWARLVDGTVGEFFTSMSGEIVDRLTSQGLLASVVDGAAVVGEAFHDGLAQGAHGEVGLATLLFGARARVVRGVLEKRDAGSFIRGVLIGAELRDAERLIGLRRGERVAIVGNAPLCALYAAALEWHGSQSRSVASRDACVAGFRALAVAASA